MFYTGALLLLLELSLAAELGLFFTVVCGVLNALASLVGEHKV